MQPSKRYATRPTDVSCLGTDTWVAIAARGGGLYPFSLRPAKKKGGKGEPPLPGAVGPHPVDLLGAVAVALEGYLAILAR